MSALSEIDWDTIEGHYQQRVEIHRQLISLYDSGKISDFSKLSLGISDAHGNYSAWRHKLGLPIRSQNANSDKRVFDLAGKFRQSKTADNVPALIDAAGLQYLQIGVGSEISCMVHPAICWVANTRTFWTHLVVRPGGTFESAAEQLTLFRSADTTGEMDWELSG